MKNKKGFTLIELLAVIVILAIIALIATPIILNMINDARKNSAKSSALGYIDAIEYNNGFAQLGTADINGTYEEIKSGDVSTANQKLGSHLKGKAPTSGTVTIDSKGKVTAADFCINGYNVTYDGKDAKVNGKCNGSNNNNNEPEQPSVPEPVSFATDDWSTIAANTTSSVYEVGQEKEIQMDVNDDGDDETYHLMIVNMTPCVGGETSQTACGMVLQFKELLNITDNSNKQMNSDLTSVGGWKDCKMRIYLNSTIYSKLPSELRSEIKNTKVISGHESGVENNYETNDKLYLLSFKEVGITTNYDTLTETRKLDYYDEGTGTGAKAKRIKYIYGTETEAYYWWLRSAYYNTSSSFCNVKSGSYDFAHANTNGVGVSPAFRIGIANEKISVFKSGTEVNVMMKKLAGTNASDESTIDSNITAIKRSNTEPNISNKTNDNIVSLSSSDYPIYMWYSNGTIYWWSESNKIYLNSDSSFMFNKMSNLSDISGLENFNVSGVTSLASLFHSDKITDLSALSNWNISNVQSLRSTFYNNDIKKLDGLENWNTSNVTTMEFTFNKNVNLTNSSAINRWNIGKVTTFNQMFGNYNSSPAMLPSHPTFVDSNNNPIPGTWSNDGTFTKQ